MLRPPYIARCAQNRRPFRRKTTFHYAAFPAIIRNMITKSCFRSTKYRNGMYRRAVFGGLLLSLEGDLFFYRLFQFDAAGRFNKDMFSNQIECVEIRSRSL